MRFPTMYLCTSYVNVEMIHEISRIIKQSKSIQQLQLIHGQTITRGFLSFHPHLILINILHAFTFLPITPTTLSPPSSSFSLINYAVSIFNLIPNPSTFSYNNLIRAYTLLSSPSPALLLFARMRRLSVPPDSHTFPFVLKACSLLIRRLSLAQTLHSQSLKFGFLVDLYLLNNLIHVYSVFDRINDAYQLFDESSQRDIVSYNALIDGFVKAGDIDQARQLFDAMPEKDVVSWGTLLAGYAGNGMDHCKEAIVLFNQMLHLAYRPDNVALVSALSACAQLGELDEGRKIHDYIKRKNIRLDAFLSTGLVDFYAKCGCIETAMEIFELSSGKNLFTWNAMLIGLAMHGHGQQSLLYFFEMIEAGIKPDGVSFLGVLVACSHAGLVGEARQLFGEMEAVYKVPRELKHYGCMVDLLARAGLMREATEMIHGMPMGGDIFVWGGLLGGCKTHGNIDIAQKAAENVMLLKPEDGGVYSIMASVYADAERWDEVAKIRRLMNTNKVKKNAAGCSLIQLDGFTHEFVAGDSCLHPQADEIYFLLNRIGKHHL